MKKIRFGILAAPGGGIGPVGPALNKSRYCEAAATALHDGMFAEASQKNREALLADPDIDAVYLPLPVDQRVDWAIRAMRVGKHVLCETPCGLGTEDINRLIDATSRYPDVKVVEALAYRHHPQWQDAKRRIESGEIGRLVTLHSFYSHCSDDPEGFSERRGAGDGIMKTACHCVSLSRFLFGTEPVRVCGFADHDPETGTDRLFSGMLDFSGSVATFTCSTGPSAYQRVNILGSAGRIEVFLPFDIPGGAPTQTALLRDDDSESPIRTITFGVCDHYAAMADAFARAILDDTPVSAPLTDAWANIHVIEVLRESARLGAWVAC